MEQPCKWWTNRWHWAIEVCLWWPWDPVKLFAFDSRILNYSLLWVNGTNKQEKILPKLKSACKFFLNRHKCPFRTARGHCKECILKIWLGNVYESVRTVSLTHFGTSFLIGKSHQQRQDDYRRTYYILKFIVVTRHWLIGIELSRVCMVDLLHLELRR